MQDRTLRRSMLAGLSACAIFSGLAAVSGVDAGARSEGNTATPNPRTAVAPAGVEALRALGINGLADPTVRVEQRPLSPREVIDRVQRLAPGRLEARNLARLERQLRSGTRQLQSAGGESSGGVLISCEILDALAQPVSQVDIAEFGDQPSWLFYSGGIFVDEVTFVVTPMFEGAAMTGISHSFELDPPSGTPIVTPFGIPFWGGDRNCGSWMLVVENSLGDMTTCEFEVLCEEPPLESGW